MRRAFIVLFVLSPLLAAGIGCGNSSSSSPNAPSSNGSGAVISGSLTSGQANASIASVGVRPAGTGAGLTVTIAGTPMSTIVDSSGQFTFRNVPGGNVALMFTGPGVNGEVDLDSVEMTETITLVLTMSGASIGVDSEHRHGGSQDQLEGLIQSLPPSVPAGTFVVAGQTVTTDANTTFTNHGAAATFASLTLGARVHVSGHSNGSALVASTVMIQSGGNSGGGGDNGGGDQQSASIDGSLTSIAGAIPNLTLSVGGTIVTTSASTEVRRRGDVQDLSVLQVGMNLHVEGTRLANGSIAARMLQIKDDASGGAFQISGSMGGLHGTCPSVQFVVNGFSIFTDGSTVFSPACSTFKSGTKVTVNGVTQPDGSIKATNVAKQ